MLITSCLVERRSKGKLYIAKDRTTGERCTLRKIFLDVTNAGQDDGLPTSVLREISNLKTVNHPNIVKIKHAEVKNELAQIVYEFNEHNLKDYMKKVHKESMLLQMQSKNKLERSLSPLPLHKIKMILF